MPLFVGELTKSVLERAEAPVGIPPTLRDPLMARLNRLGWFRQVAQIGSAIGREFSYALLRADSGLPDDALQRAFARLIASELVFRRATPPDAIYSFKHALVQDAEDGSLLRNVRRQSHAQIAGALQTHLPELRDSQPELFAQHYGEAGLVQKSIACWAKAGYSSAAHLAMAEAVAQFRKALDSWHYCRHP